MSTDPNYPPPESNYGAAPPGAGQYGVPDRSEAASKKLAAGITGILLGSLGVHKFVLGYTNAGIIMLAVTLSTLVAGFATCGITMPVAGVMGVIGVVEGVIYLTKSDDEFYETYMVGKREWF